MSVRSTGGADISSQIIIWLFCMRIYCDILSFKYVLPSDSGEYRINCISLLILIILQYSGFYIVKLCQVLVLGSETVAGLAHLGHGAISSSCNAATLAAPPQ